MKFTVAIDGPAASGKGTIARALAAKFGFQHLDTGLLYRAIGMMVDEGADPIAAATALTPEDLKRPDLRSVGAGRAASKVAIIPEVREILLDFQKRFANAPGGAILDGRDIGTVVCPKAEVKLFVTAEDTVRAKRRWEEEGGEAASLSYEQVLGEVRARDARDRDRETAPMVAAKHALNVDTSTLRIDEAVELCMSVVAKAMADKET